MGRVREYWSKTIPFGTGIDRALTDLIRFAVFLMVVSVMVFAIVAAIGLVG